MRYELGDIAEEDLEGIRLHFSEPNQERYLARLLASIQVSIEGLCEFPEAWPEREPGIRKRVLRRYPYVLIYAVDREREVVVVLRVVHQSREY
ncbi:MAG TPA: type II toxin-antitoxin system RelE/ParE family toxin [Chloroflexota bacterium]|nr:type II toxin-antitoxin system RelE/ParE family toxin [Chloroflexota bacterium]